MAAGERNAVVGENTTAPVLGAVVFCMEKVKVSLACVREAVE
jgi:hypothetical protein